MSLNNPFATFLGKKITSTNAGIKRSRVEEDISLVPTSLTETRRTTSSATDAASVSDVSPNAAELTHDKNSFSTIPASSSPVKVVLLPDDGEEEEEELRLLLGDTNKVFIRPEKVTLPAVAETGRILNESPLMGEAVHTVDSSNKAVSLKDLPWDTRSNTVLEELAERFEAQFKWELQKNKELLDVFEPFFSDRALDRIENNHQKAQFLPATNVTVEKTATSGGYTLRSYQLTGVQFMLNKFHSGMPCILADDMGLGKTAQIASFLNFLKSEHNIDGPHLIVSPLSTLTSWTRELARWSPTLRVVKYHGERKGRTALRSARVNRHCVYVTTPSVLNQDRGFFRKRAWVVAVVDEAHVLKGSSTMISSVARKLKSCFRIAVTGTPVHNNVGEVWSLLSFLYPSFCTRYDGSDDNTVEAAENSARLLQHIMLRRTKGSIELGIPPRVDEPTIMINPTGVQQRLLTRMTEQVLSENESSGTSLQLHLTHQRIVCNHPLALRLLAAEGRNSGNSGWEERMMSAGVPLEESSIITPSAKMIELDRMLRKFKEEGHRCLIFSNFTSILDLLQALCVLRGYSFERLDGSTQRVERELSMTRFNAPDSACFLFLLTTTAGGVGVTLTGADTVILFDSHYNPQIDRQAADRAHRIGQTRVVRVYRLCLRNTMEERILNVALRKASLGDFIVEGGSCKGDESSGMSLSADRIRQLFEVASNTTNNNNTLNTNDNNHNHITDSALENKNKNKNDDDEVVDVDADDVDTTAEDLMVEDLLHIQEEGLPKVFTTKIESRSGRQTVGVTHNCFVCGEIMRPLEPLYHCSVCPKAYHADCIGERKLQVGVNSLRHWTCSRHSCSSCGKAQAVDGAIFMCTECPLAFCFDCLDPRYFDLDENKTQFVHIRRMYPGMEMEGMDVRQSVYYITCLRCCGVLSSSTSSSSSSVSDEDEDAVSSIDNDNDNNNTNNIINDDGNEGEGGMDESVEEVEVHLI
ncbi:transcription activator [Trypanosoma theileri]|uniref:Transcription activator n=1 Tax=Trypanosoma theileri TaxID=67003 RepID=A0A1X0NY53_9TRYP|nr:transcription activator [Trypanosoma theileri]ORC89605.1 transcription activator [Trypanosoma theileri]